MARWLAYLKKSMMAVVVAAAAAAAAREWEPYMGRERGRGSGAVAGGIVLEMLR